MVASVVADALQKAQAQAQQEQAARDAAKAEYEEELARVCVYELVHTCKPKVVCPVADYALTRILDDF